VKTRTKLRNDSYWQPCPVNSGRFRDWLRDEGSLTRRLQRRCKQFKVRQVVQRWGRPLPDERRLLDLREGQTALVREVWLQDGAERLVFARSILPRASLRGAWRQLGRLGNRPLGAALFSDSEVVRLPLAYRKLGLRHRMRKETGVLGPLWARRSVFLRDGHAILVTEVFMPEVLTL
jgi:chorismate--pyruvate lyase